MSAPHEVDKLAYSKYIILPPVAALLLSVISSKSSKFLLTERTDVTIGSIAYVVLTIIKLSVSLPASGADISSLAHLSIIEIRLIRLISHSAANVN